MGHGDCENMSHTITVIFNFLPTLLMSSSWGIPSQCFLYIKEYLIQIPVATDDVGVLQRLATQLFGHFHLGTLIKLWFITLSFWFLDFVNVVFVGV